MADPTLQTYCCHHHQGQHGTDMATRIMREFDTETYNAVCMVSAIVGMLGASYQILPRQEDANARTFFACSAVRGRKIITWLAVSDLLASIGVFMRSVVWLNNRNIMPGMSENATVLFCALTSAWVQYFYTATWIWTLCYAMDMRCILSEKQECTGKYHAAAWMIPAFTTSIGLFLLYYPNADIIVIGCYLSYNQECFSCHTSRRLSAVIMHILPNYLMTYCPMAIVMITNPFLYAYSSRDMSKIIMHSSGQFTSREREMIHSIKIKLLAINVVFYVCWTPNLLNGLLLWTLWFHLPVKVLISLWYVMALVNPLQAFFNCMVYRRWNFGWVSVSTMSWNRQAEEKEELMRSAARNDSEEHLPLLRGFKRSNSINGFHHRE